MNITIIRGTHTGASKELIANKLIVPNKPLLSADISFSIGWDISITHKYAIEAAKRYNSKPCIVKLDINPNNFKVLQNYLYVFHSSHPEISGSKGTLSHKMKAPNFEYLTKYQGEIEFSPLVDLQNLLTDELMDSLNARFSFLGEENEFHFISIKEIQREVDIVDAHATNEAYKFNTATQQDVKDYNFWHNR